jgi:hypothetical protein
MRLWGRGICHLSPTRFLEKIKIEEEENVSNINTKGS